MKQHKRGLYAVLAAKPTLFLQSRYPEVQHCASDDFIDRQQRWRDCSANDVGHRLPPIRRNAFAGYWRLPEPDLREGELGHKDKHSHLGAICDVAHIPIRWRRCNPRQPGTRTGRNPASVFSPGAMHQTKCEAAMKRRSKPLFAILILILGLSIAPASARAKPDCMVRPSC